MNNQEPAKSTPGDSKKKINTETGADHAQD